MHIHEILNLCHTLKIEAHHHKFTWDPKHSAVLSYTTARGDKIEVKREGNDPLETWNEAWEALNDLAHFGFTLAPQIEHQPDYTRPLAEAINDEIPF